MKKTIGYGFKMNDETWEAALAAYRDAGFCKTKKEVQEDIERGKQSNDIKRDAKPKVFKVTIEI